MKSKAFSGMTLILFITSILTLALNIQPVKASGNILYTGADGWLYRKAHNITGSTEGNQTYYQMKVVVYYGNGIDSGENVYLNGHCRTDFGDVRFTDNDGSTLLDYWMESKIDGDNAVFWVEVADDLSTANATIYVYYGKSDATTTSNGANTFIFFEDFEVDLSAWTVTQYGEATITRVTTQAYQGSYSAKDTDATDSCAYANRTFSAKDMGAVTVFFYDDGTTKQQSAFVDDGATVIMIGRNDPVSGSYYIYRIGDTNYITTIPFSVGWHKFEFIYGSGNAVTLKIDGTTIYSGTPPASYSRMIFGDFWYDSAGDPKGPGYYDCWCERKYVSSEPAHGSWGSEEIIVPYIVIDRAFVSDERADVGSVQTIGFHAEWDNGSDVVGGEVYVNGTNYITNNAGWIFFNDVSSVVDRKTWIVTGVNCSGVTVYVQTAPTPSIIWDQIKIVDGGATKETVMVGETATIWFQAIYEYDGVFFEDINGILYVDGSEMSWSTNHRWEYNYTAAVHGPRAFIITGVSDSLYGLAAINDPIGAQTIIALGQPTLTVSLDSSTAYIGYKVKISGKLSYPINTGISGANLLLVYSVTGGESWNDITSVTTTADGDYFVEWMPTATGNYSVRVSWEGNETLYVAGTEVYSTLAVIPVEGKYVFSVISNSTVSELAFNSTSRVLSFTVSGPSGTMGCTRVTIAKTLIGDISELKVYLDGNQISYAVVSTEDSFLLDFTYQHSTHEVVVSLGPPPFIPPQLITPLSLCILAIALAVATAILIFKIRKRTPTTILDSILR